MIKKSWARILSDAKATKDLSAYSFASNCVAMNKFVSFGLLPLVLVVAGGHFYKFPAKMVT